MIQVPLFNLEAITDKIKLVQISKDVIESSSHILGKNVQLFERNFSNYIGTEFCFGVGNGTDALLIALRSLNVSKDSTVATVANAGFYSSTAINQIGAKIVYIDIDETSMLIDIENLEINLKNENIDVLIVTHLYGQVVPMDKILNLSKKYGFKILEDCAQSHGSNYKGQKTGSFGHVSAFSFYPTKNLGAVGDAGAVLTSETEIADRIIALRQYGWTKKYRVDFSFGSNSRLDEIQAAFLNFKLQFLDEWNNERLRIANIYIEKLSDLPIGISNEIIKGVCHLFVIQVEDRQKLIEYLQKKGIQSAIHYPIPDHKQSINAQKFKNLELKNTEKVVQNILTLPLYPGMDETKINYTIKSIREFYKDK
jgi:dTDP-4-amino-4,6-dideoxygalactose transaminase